jgi:hypothetical protein
MVKNTVGSMNNLRDEAPAAVPQTTPDRIGYGHPEYQFVTSIMEMQKSLGEINRSISDLTKSVDSTKSKVDDLIAWKNRVLGGAIAFGAACSLVAWLIIQASHYVTLKNPAEPQQPVTQAPQPTPERPAH